MVQHKFCHGSKKYTYHISTEEYFKEKGRPIPDKYIEKTAEELGVITDPAIANQTIKGWRR